MWCNRFRGACDIAKVRLVIFIQRSGNANNNRVHLLELSIIGGGRETLIFGLLNFLSGNAKNVRPAGVEGRDLPLIDIETSDREVSLAVKQGQRKPYVAEPDNRDFGLALLNLALQFRKMGGGNRLAAHNLKGEISSDSSMRGPIARRPRTYRFPDKCYNS